MIKKIHIDHLESHVIIGCLDFERETKQDLFLDVELSLSNSDSWLDESLDHSIDYTVIKDQIKNICEKGEFLYIETLASFVAHWLLTKHEQLASASVSVTKPQALDGEALPRVSVSVERDEIGAFAEKLGDYDWVDEL